MCFYVPCKPLIPGLLWILAWQSMSLTECASVLPACGYARMVHESVVHHFASGTCTSSGITTCWSSLLSSTCCLVLSCKGCSCCSCFTLRKQASLPLCTSIHTSMQLQWTSNRSPKIQSFSPFTLQCCMVLACLGVWCDEWWLCKDHACQ